jgi:two-component system, OmpR family, sensor histidine kinase BaeS
MSPTGSTGRGPRRRPPWWPEGEEWPPKDWSGYRGGPWRHRAGPPFMLRFGCAIFFLAVFLVVAISALVWVVGSVLGGIASPPAGNGLLIGLLIVATVAALLAFRGVRRMSAPLDELADAAERIERGDYTARVSLTGPPRMRSLAHAFNDMSTRLAAVDEGRREFLADAAHELRTPLSIIAGQLEAIEDGLYPADAEHLAPVHEQLHVLEQLIEDMRTVALAEAGALPLKLQPTDLAVAIDHVVAAFQAEATASGVNVRADYPSGLPRARADEHRVGQILTNLMSNALRHTPRGGHVTVLARAVDAQWIELSVRDDGPGIPADLLPRVFDRFVKEPGSSGTGLGLAICRDLVEAQGGTISIDSAPGRGVTVTFTLPTA